MLEINKIVIDFKSHHNSETIRIMNSEYIVNNLKQCPKDRYIDQYNRIENLEINPHICGPFIFNVGSTQFIGRKNRLYKKWLFNNWVYLFRKK